jgi:predicted amidohydrolase
MGTEPLDEALWEPYTSTRSLALPHESGSYSIKALLLDPAGAERLRYHKMHPFSYAGEDEHYAAGDTLPTVQVGDVRLTALICYDLRFADPFLLAAPDTDIFVVIANWASARRHAWQSLLVARAIECQSYVLGVNRVGEGDGVEFSGDSALLSPLGETLSSAAQEPALVMGRVSADTVSDVRERYPFLSDRRPGLYRTLRSAES